MIEQTLQTQFRDGLKELRFDETEIAEQDWMEEWKKHFHVLQLCDHVWICPSWREFTPTQGSFVIWMDPGMAFGTGHHASTQLIAQALEDQVVAHIGRGASPSVLDVGTGTGVLAIAAAYLGATSVVAVDEDPEATRIARENVTKNNLDAIVHVDDLPVEKLRRKFDIVCANIIAEVHHELLRYYLMRLKPSGTLLLSGIIQERVDGLKFRIEENGWVVLNQRAQGEWVCLTAIRERRRSQRSTNL